MTNDDQYRDLLDVTYLDDEQPVFPVDQQRFAVTSSIDHHLVERFVTYRRVPIRFHAN